MEKPLVSILTPFKNTEKFLNECLDSILDQSYSNWELIIVDDHSSDGSYQLVKSYAQKDTRIKLIKNYGQGIIDALQLAYSHSGGSYITRMDSDDIMHNNKIETLVSLLMSHGKGYLATGCVSYFSKTGISDGYRKYETWLNSLTTLGHNYSEIYKECVIPSPCWMVHRVDFEVCGGFNSQVYPEDYDLTFRFYEKQLKIIPCDNLLHYWRDYSTRASRTDAHYAENSFLDLKLRYFLKLDNDKHRPLVVWGAGKKGKSIAQKLIDKEQEFIWICDNPKKIGKSIYGKILYSFLHLKELNNPQSIVTVANSDSQLEIVSFFKTHNKIEMIDYFFFC